MVSCPVFKSLSRFIFVYGVRVCANFTYLREAVHLSQCPLLKDCLSSTVYPCLLCQRFTDHRFDAFVFLKVHIASQELLLSTHFFPCIPENYSQRTELHLSLLH